ncbi:MAG: cytochrome c [Blastocatellia bacterium]|nr:cytochrome c [Blastocatellia bacterium]
MKLKKTLIPLILILIVAAAFWRPVQMRASGEPVQEIKSVFASKCAVCHGMDGSANTAKGKELKVKDMRSPEVQAMSDDKLYEVIAKGKGKMIGYEKTLGKEKVEQLVAYTRELGKKK